MKTKALSILLSLVMVCSLFTALPMTANAATETVTDTLTADDFAATSTSYKDFSDVKKNTAVYAGQSARDGSGNIQLRVKNSNSGIVSTTSGGKVKSVTINVGSGGHDVYVYGSNTAYTSAADLFDSNKQGTLIDWINSTGTVSFSDDYAYVGIRSSSGAVYLSSVEIAWEVESDEPEPTAAPTEAPTEAPTAAPAASIKIVNKDAYVEDGKGYMRYITELTFDPGMTVESFGTWFIPANLLNITNDYAAVQYAGSAITSGQTYTADLLGIPGSELVRNIVGISFANFAGSSETLTTSASATVNSIIAGGTN